METVADYFGSNVFDDRTQKAMLRVKYTFLFFSEINLFTRNTSTYTLWIKRI